MAASRVAAIALAASVMALTVQARADSAAPAAPAASAAPEGSTPLSLRPSKPLELAREPEAPGAGWKLVAVLVIAAGAGFYWRKRFMKPGTAPDAGQLTIVRRVTVGLRSELLVVNVEGQRLLVGVTPQSIQSLAILDGDAPGVAEAAASTPTSATGSVVARFDALLDASEERRSSPRSAPKRTREPEPKPMDEDLGQARGLLALRRRG